MSSIFLKAEWRKLILANYPVEQASLLPFLYQIACDFSKLYGAAFAGLEAREPQSVFLAEGSPISVYTKKNV